MQIYCRHRYRVFDKTLHVALPRWNVTHPTLLNIRDGEAHWYDRKGTRRVAGPLKAIQIIFVKRPLPKIKNNILNFG